MTAIVLRGDARQLPLPDGCVDLIVTSPPYWALRDYRDGGASMAGQIGSEPTWQEWLANLIDCTREWARVLKPTGSMFVNLADKYSGSSTSGPPSSSSTLLGNGHRGGGPKIHNMPAFQRPPVRTGIPAKSLVLLPERYVIACADQLGLIVRRDIIWAKPNGLPESVTDRCRSSHEYLFHLVKQPRYYAAVDEIREPHTGGAHHGRSDGRPPPNGKLDRAIAAGERGGNYGGTNPAMFNPLGKLPGSVWSIPSQPLTVPPHLGVDHFACVDTDTEILTPRGWLRHDQLTEGDQVAGYDLNTSTARWTECTAVNRYDYDGEMVAVESRDLSMRLTPNHRTIVQRMDTRTKRRNPVSVVRADELTRYHFIPRSASWERYGDFYAGERLAAVLGWVAAEGWYQALGVYLSQSLDVNAPHVAEIDRLLPDAARTERKRTYRGRPWTEVTWRLGAVAALVQREMPEKLLPWWLLAATEPERYGVLNAFIGGDGHRRPDGRIGIYQKHRHNLDVLQAVAVTLGYKTTLREGGGRFVLYLTEGGRSVTMRGTAGVGSKVRREHYTGTVWCPTTGTGTFIARRNGSVFVTGNSFPMELPRRCVLGWSPPGICTSCGEGRRPVVKHGPSFLSAHPMPHPTAPDGDLRKQRARGQKHQDWINAHPATITGYACACTPCTDYPERRGTSFLDHADAASSGRTTNGSERNRAYREGRGGPSGPVREYHFDGWTPPPTRPAVILDPFGGTGTTALVASMLGRVGVSIDRSADYSRLARWRCTDPGERAKALQVPKPPPVPDGMEALF